MGGLHQSAVRCMVLGDKQPGVTHTSSSSKHARVCPGPCGSQWPTAQVISVCIVTACHALEWHVHKPCKRCSKADQNHNIDGIVLETGHANKGGQAAVYSCPPS